MDNNYINATDDNYSPDVVVLEMVHMYMKNYNYIIIDPGSRKSVIVDPAWQLEKVDQALSANHASLTGILITHSHPDHIHLAKPLSEKYDCPIWMSKQEILFSGFDAQRLVGIDETPWNVGNIEIKPMLTPGHTPGCICYQVSDNLFTGDVLFAEGCGMCPDVNGAYAMFASLEKLKESLKPQCRIFPGHSYGKTPGQLFSSLLKDNIYLQFNDKDSFAGFRMRPGQNKSKMFRFR